MTGGCRQVSFTSVRKDIFGRACLQASCFRNKGRENSRICDTAIFGFSERSKEQMRSSAVYILTAFIIGDYKYSMTVQTVAVTWIVKEIFAGNIIAVILQ
jgi:hypothetical protein